MGLTYADIELINPSEIEMARRSMIGDEEIKRLRLNLLVDSGAPI